MGKPASDRPAMTGDEFLAARNRLGLSAAGAALLFGVDDRSIRRWESGDRSVTEPAAQFVRYLLATGATGRDALEVLGIALPPGMG